MKKLKNQEGQSPTSGGADTVERLREKAKENRGEANRERIERKIGENQGNNDLEGLDDEV